MTTTKVSRLIAGKRAEHLVFSELLKRDIVPYIPIVDVGYDALVRTPDGGLIEIQIKSSGGAGGKYHRWFQTPRFTPRPNFFIVCVSFLSGGNEEFWVFPSAVFDEYANRPPKGDPRDLDLDSGKRKYGNPLTDHLCGFRDRWDLIANYEEWRRFMTSPEGFEDLEDILAAREAQESPEEERMSFEEYVRRFPETL